MLSFARKEAPASLKRSRMRAETWGFKLPLQLPLPLATPLETKGTVEVMVFVQKAPAAGIRVRSSINWLLGCIARFASVSAA